MATNPRRRNTLIIILILIIIAILLLLLRCNKNPTQAPPKSTSPTPTITPAPSTTAPPATTPPPAAENLTPATITAPQTAPAGSQISLTWTGPDNPGDYITITPKEAPKETANNYAETKQGPSLTLTTPITPGPYELRYIANRSKTILGRAPIQITEVTATLDAPAQVPLNAPFSVSWTGPNNKGDYITIVEPDAAAERFASYAETEKGPTLTLTSPPTAGTFELRYVTGQGGGARKILARRSIRTLTPSITLSAPDSITAGAAIQITWTGPDNSGDYITIVPGEKPDGQYGNYTYTAKGSPLEVLSPLDVGPAEIRYMTTAGSKVLARRSLTINAAAITLTAPPEDHFGSDISIAWTGPDNPGDYITIVPKSTPDGQYGPYTYTTKGSPLTVTLPKPREGGDKPITADYEVRYQAGQGNRVLARAAIKIIP